MRKLIPILLILSFLLVASGCSKASVSSNSPGATPTLAVPTQTEAPTLTSTPIPTPTSQPTPLTQEPTSTPSPTPEITAVSSMSDNCRLLNSHDLASFFSSAEVMLPTPKVTQENHVIFSTEDISTTETSCVYYVFHLPGSKDMQLLQVNYWLDVPYQVASAAWAKVWTDASSQAAQVVPGIGDGAFFDKGKLTFKKGDIYMTIEVTGTQVTTETPAGVTQQLEIEKQIAQDALKNF